MESKDLCSLLIGSRIAFMSALCLLSLSVASLRSRDNSLCLWIAQGVLSAVPKSIGTAS